MNKHLVFEQPNQSFSTSAMPDVLIKNLLARPPLSDYIAERMHRSDEKSQAHHAETVTLDNQARKALFLKHQEKLSQVLAEHGAYHSLAPGEVLLKAGEFNTSLFILVRGNIDAHQDIDALLPTRSTKKGNPLMARLKASRHFGKAIEQRWRSKNHDLTQTQMSYLSVALEQLPLANHQIQAPDSFGEYGALRRDASPFTFVATQAAEVLEIRWQGVRVLNKFSRTFKYTVQKNYLARGFLNQLQRIPLFQPLKPKDIDTLQKRVGFESYGKQNWTSTFDQIDETEQQSRINHEPLVVEEGDYVDSLYLILSGFARVTHQQDQHHHTVNYLRSGDIFGLFEVVHNRYQAKPLPYQYSLRAVGYLDVIRIPLSLISSMALPLPLDTETQQLIEASLRQQASVLPGYDALGQRIALDQKHLNKQSQQMEFFVQERYINGREAMLINLDRCTGCDDCVRACAINHDNNPRFIRDGKQIDNLLVTNACMHCHDPVCLVGCPTGAIRRTPSSEVIINDADCIGCAGCANACPYGNIKMVDVHYPNGHPDLNEQGMPIVQKATKCDLCSDSLGQPACVQACPHDALQRVDIKDHALHLFYEATE